MERNKGRYFLTVGPLRGAIPETAASIQLFWTGEPLPGKSPRKSLGRAARTAVSFPAYGRLIPVPTKIFP
jgi:hypothetical protein